MAQFQRAGRNRNPTQFNGKGNCATTLQQLCIEKEGEDTKQLALHRNILSNGCEFFDRMLSGMFQALAQIVSMLLWVEPMRSIVRRCCSDAELFCTITCRRFGGRQFHHRLAQLGMQREQQRQRPCPTLASASREKLTSEPMLII